jgi:CheY-like chemotaxis protein
VQRGCQHIFAINGAADFLYLVRELLEDSSYNVTTTNFVPKTFAEILAMEPNLIIIDLALHIHAGWDVLEHLHTDVLDDAVRELIGVA